MDSIQVCDSSPIDPTDTDNIDNVRALGILVQAVLHPGSKQFGKKEPTLERELKWLRKKGLVEVYQRQITATDKGKAYVRGVVATPIQVHVREGLRYG